jgi:hypothetical protein
LTKKLLLLLVFFSFIWQPQTCDALRSGNGAISTVVVVVKTGTAATLVATARPAVSLLGSSRAAGATGLSNKRNLYVN